MMSKYDPQMVDWMEKELIDIGVKALKTESDVDSFMKQPGTSMILVNSVCGCAAGGARPGVGFALQNKVIPDNIATVFAGVDKDATANARTFFSEVPPSSPSVAVLKDGALVHFIPRHEIEGFDYEQIAAKLTPTFDEHCKAEGPSVSQDKLKEAFSSDERNGR